MASQDNSQDNDKVMKPVATVPQPEQVFPVTIEEFCSHLSLTDRRVELIGAFDAYQRAKNRVSALPAQYQTDFEIFCGLPA